MCPVDELAAGAHLTWFFEEFVAVPTAGFQIVGTWTEPPGYQLVLARPCGLSMRPAADVGTTPPEGGFRTP